MIDEYGKFFHIDFGYTFDQDPNLSSPPPFKVTEGMMEIFNGEKYDSFVNKCVAIYKKFRVNSNLLVNLMHLMTDSDLTINPNKGR